MSPVVPSGFVGPFLKAEALQLLQTVLPRQSALPGQAPFLSPVADRIQGELAADSAAGMKTGPAEAGQGSKVAAAGAVGEPAAARFTASGSKVPKWLKMGK